MISLPLFECISPIENVVFVVLAQMDWFNPKSFSCDVKEATFFLSATVGSIKSVSKFVCRGSLHGRVGTSIL